MDESETDQAGGVTRNDAGELRVGLGVVAVKSGKHDCLINPRSTGSPQILFNRRVGVPWRCQQVAFAGVTVSIDNHESGLTPARRTGEQRTNVLRRYGAVRVIDRAHLQVRG